MVRSAPAGPTVMTECNGPRESRNHAITQLRSHCLVQMSGAAECTGNLQMRESATGLLSKRLEALSPSHGVLACVPQVRPCDDVRGGPRLESRGLLLKAGRRLQPLPRLIRCRHRIYDFLRHHCGVCECVRVCVSVSE
jgi:hypothetical protein